MDIQTFLDEARNKDEAKCYRALTVLTNLAEHLSNHCTEGTSVTINYSRPRLSHIDATGKLVFIREEFDIYASR